MLSKSRERKIAVRCLDYITWRVQFESVWRDLVILQNKLDDKVCSFSYLYSVVSVLLEKGRGVEKGIGWKTLSPRFVNSITAQPEQRTQELKSSLLKLTYHNFNSKWFCVLTLFVMDVGVYGSEVNLPNGGLDLSGGPFRVKWFIPGVSWSGSVLHWMSSPIPVPLLFLQDLSCRAVAAFTLRHTVKYPLRRREAARCCPARPRTSSGRAAFPWMSDTGTQQEIAFALVLYLYIICAVEELALLSTTIEYLD